MKKMLIGTMMLAAMAVTQTNAQLRDNLSLGPIAGIGHSWLSDFSGVKFNPSFNGGARLVYSATPNFGFGLDATFRTEGVKWQAGAANISKGDIGLHYINIDPKVYYFFGKYGQALRPKIGVGPNFGFLVGGKTKTTNGNSAELTGKSKDAFNSFNFGLAGTIGFNYRLKSKTWLNIDAVYNNGFTDLSKINNTDTKSRSIFLNAGVTFGIGHAGTK